MWLTVGVISNSCVMPWTILFMKIWLRKLDIKGILWTLNHIVHINWDQDISIEYERSYSLYWLISDWKPYWLCLLDVSKLSNTYLEHRFELRKSIILKITAVDWILYPHKLFSLNLNGTRAITQKLMNLLITLLKRRPVIISAILYNSFSKY